MRCEQSASAVSRARRRRAYVALARASSLRVDGALRSSTTRPWSRWLTQPGPRASRPSTRATVSGSPAMNARRRSGPSDLATERTTAQRLRPWLRGVASGAGDRSLVIVFDDQQLGSAEQDALQRGDAYGVESGAGRVVRTRGQDHRLGAGLQCRGQRIRPRPIGVDGDRYGLQVHGAQQVEHGEVARVFDDDAVTGHQVRRQRALHAVERATGEADVRRRRSRLRQTLFGPTPAGVGRPTRRRTGGSTARVGREMAPGRAAGPDPDCRAPGRARQAAATSRPDRSGSRRAAAD